MNKRFSTLLAAALVAGGLSSNVMATNIVVKDLEEGQFIHLSTATDGSKYLTMNEKGEFSTPVDAASWTGKIENLLGTLWQVKKNPHESPAGTFYTYSLINRVSGQMLSVKLQSNIAGGGRAAITASAPATSVAKDYIAVNEEGGNTDWAYEAGKGFYAIKGDSVFSIGINETTGHLSFSATKAAVAPGNTTLYMGDVLATGVTLTADDFNALVKKEGKKLFFTDENVSASEKNVLTDNTWEAVNAVINSTTGEYAAVGAGAANVLYLTNGKEYKNRQNVAMNAADVTQKEYLLVDYNFYDPDKTFNILKTDTIAAEPAVAAVTGLAARTKIAKHHPATAAFTVKYFIPNDSMVIAPAFAQTSIPVATTLDAMHTALPTEGVVSAVKAVVNKLETGVTLFSTANKATDFPKGAKFAEVTKFDADGAAGSAKTGQDLIDAVKDEIKKVTYSDVAATKKKEEAYVAKVNAYLASLAGLEISTASTSSDAAFVSTTAIKDGANYADGLNNLTVAAITDKQVVLRKLSSTKVLTIGQIEGANGSTSLHGNLIATIKTTDKDVTIGGDAEIAEDLYYVVDKKKGAKNDSKTFGLFYDMTPVKAEGAQFAAEGQAFNPFTQFVVEKAAGVEKGNYVITNRGTATSKFKGVTNVVDKDNKIYAIGTDTIQLVKADDVDADAATIGFKYITSAEANNNKFTITSAADVLEGYSLVMRSDSSVAVAEADEVLYTLVPSADVKYGFDEELICKTYSIMNADSAYLIEADDKFVFSNGKYGKENGTPAKFSLIAVDSESTYVLACLEKGHEGKMVISTQYKTISTEELGHARNDLFFVTPEAAPASYKSLPKHVQIMGVDGNYMAVNSKNQGVAVREGDELKAAYATEDFTFWLDTADYANAETYKYYITKGVKATEETAASRMFLFNAKDSVNVSEANKDLLTYGNNGARAIFRTASILAKDTLLVPQLNTTAKIDTVSSAAGKSVDGLEHKVIATIENFKFAFEYTDNEGEYVIKSNNSFVHNINGVLVMGNEKDALVVNVKAADAPTSNEGVEVSEMTVIAGEGNVTIAGAAGKKVVISNILGQVVANTVLSSDNATIAAPQGVVVIAVEGEEAVKAIVK